MFNIKFSKFGYFIIIKSENSGAMMTKVLILTFLIANLALADTYPTFEQYIVTFNKSYSEAEAKTRKQIYDARIEGFKNITTYTPGVNKFTDWTDQQIKALSGLWQVPTQSQVSSQLKSVKVGSSRLGAPSSLDWRQRNAVTSIKDQANCGACWAFASCAYAESKLIIQGRYTKENIDLSEQYMLRCTKESACDGGYLEYAIQVVRQVPTQEQYPYAPYSYGNSLTICAAKGITTGYDYYNLYSLSDDQLIQLLQTGPVAISIASAGWTSYSSGIFSCSSSDTVDHAVLLVGYAPTYWIIKNQWNANWGENGYMRVTRNRATNCKIGQSAHFLSEFKINVYILLLLGLFFTLIL